MFLLKGKINKLKHLSGTLTKPVKRLHSICSHSAKPKFKKAKYKIRCFSKDETTCAKM